MAQSDDQMTVGMSHPALTYGVEGDGVSATSMSFPTSTANTVKYHAAPVVDQTVAASADDDQPRGDLEAPPTYKYIEDEVMLPRSQRRSPTSEFKDFLLGFFVVALGMYAVVSGLRSLTSAFPSIGCGGGPWHRNMSTVVNKLPTHFTLPSGDRIPSVALGVWRAEQGKVGEAVKTALKTGYRHIDGAWIYGNEAEVGQGIKESGVPRKDIWLTSKLWNNYHAPESIEPVLDESLSKLGTDYIDLYLIHWPVAFVKGGKVNEIDWDLTNDPYPTWQKLEELVEKGKIRNIGISNFNIKRIQNLTANPLKIQPAVNQVELSYWNPQPELLKWSKENGLLLEAYSPLGSAERVKQSLEIPEVKHIAKALGITPAQVYISWHVQRGTVVLPKSVHPSRVEENFHIEPLPQNLFEQLEKAAASHKPERSVDPSKGWGIDIFG